LMGPQSYGRTGAGQNQVIAVKGPQTDTVELVVVFADEPFASVVVLPNPVGKPFLDFLLLVAGSLGGRTVDDELVVIGFVVHCRRPEIEGILDEVERRITIGAPLGEVRDAVFELQPPCTFQVPMAGA